MLKSFLTLAKSSIGFTLIELLIVIAIIAILISIGLASYSRAQAQARDGERKSDLRNIQGALEQYYSDFNKYPTDPSGTTGDINTVKGELEGGNSEGIVYLKEVKAEDPRGNPYTYLGEEQTYCLGSDDMDTIDNASETCGSGSFGYVLTPQD